MPNNKRKKKQLGRDLENALKKCKSVDSFLK